MRALQKAFLGAMGAYLVVAIGGPLVQSNAQAWVVATVAGLLLIPAVTLLLRLLLRLLRVA
jgi:hypothetical protein